MNGISRITFMTRGWCHKQILAMVCWNKAQWLVVQVTWLFLTNQSALFQRIIAKICKWHWVSLWFYFECNQSILRPSKHHFESFFRNKRTHLILFKRYSYLSKMIKYIRHLKNFHQNIVKNHAEEWWSWCVSN